MKKTEEQNTEIHIAKDFSKHPAGRFFEDGPFSGQKFRDELLIPLLNSIESDDKFTIYLDGTRGYGSSFLEEAFGGVVRKLGANVQKKLHFISQRPSLLKEITEYMQDATNKLS